MTDNTSVDFNDTATHVAVSAQNNSPTNDQSNYNTVRNRFFIALTLMLVCGSSNDFIVMTIYQTLPESNINFHQNYWVALIITFGGFFISSFAIYVGQQSFQILTFSSFIKICLPAVMDVLINVSRYVSLIFLPAAIISVMKNGVQLISLAFIRVIFLKKVISNMQWMAIAVTVVGLVLIGIQNVFLSSVNVSNIINVHQNSIGFIIICLSGVFGAIRNSVEETLLQDLNFHYGFIVGIESVVGCLILTIIVILIVIMKPVEIDANSEWLNKQYLFSKPGIWITVFFILFLIVIYGKQIMQMKVTMLSSALSRKLFEQIYPSMTWILSIFTYYVISDKYGEKLELFSFIRLFGFILVLVGVYIYRTKENPIEYRLLPANQPSTAN